jgi:tRNA-Thr(GGU) m(6)t(6)A37 methyltransferase TsaA
VIVPAVPPDPTDAPDNIELVPIGHVASELTSLTAAPRQPDEGAPPARIVVDARHRAALDGLRPGDEIVVLTWLHLADRSTLTTHPRGNPEAPLTGVFATRSPDRPNPIGLHRARVASVDADGLSVDGLEAVDGTPVLDIKCALPPRDER